MKDSVLVTVLKRKRAHTPPPPGAAMWGSPRASQEAERLRGKPGQEPYGVQGKEWVRAEQTGSGVVLGPRGRPYSGMWPWNGSCRGIVA